jgi:Cof subfamily protein (haloacid dehalogenase superfamily)
MIVTDLDGTLLKDDKMVSEYTIEIIKKLRIEGHKFVIATARPLRAAKKFLEELEIDAGIYHNGALIYESGNKIDGFQIKNAKETVDKILSAYPNTAIAVETNDVLYSNFDAESLWPGTSYILTKSNFSEIENKKADKIIVEISSLSDMKKYESFLSEDLYMQLSENKIGMIMKKSATKSNGIHYLAQIYNIETENIIAFGDDYNDIDMLKFCGTGVCVNNGITDVKEISDYICDTNENDGVAKWIEKHIL